MCKSGLPDLGKRLPTRFGSLTCHPFQQTLHQREFGAAQIQEAKPQIVSVPFWKISAEPPVTFLLWA